MNNPSQLPTPTTPADKSVAGKARALAEKSGNFYQHHWVEVCLAIAVLSVIVVLVTPN